MKVINPTKNTLKVQIEGAVYEVKGEDSIENVPRAHANNWKERTHNFIVLKEDTVKVVEKEPKVETPTEVKEEVVEEVSGTEVENTEIVEETEEEVEEVELSYSDMQKKASKLGMEKVIGVSKADLIDFIKDN